jgi:N-methylhydantoinase A
VAIANEHMVQALRAIAIRRGADPRDHVLLSFGGAGGLHVCALAEALEMERAIVPMHAGVLSALGMLASRPGRQLSHSYVDVLDAVDQDELAQRFERLSESGLVALREEGFDETQCDIERSVDLRYLGQSYTLNVPWHDSAGSAEAFHRLHIDRYGHRMDLAVELVNIRVVVQGPDDPVVLPQLAPRPQAVPARHCVVAGIGAAVPLYRRDALAPGQRFIGPALIGEQVATTWLAPGWEVSVDEVGHLLLARVEAD